jgi:lipoprotein-anchoring transpeptidase ErfK/SrfK
MSLARPFYSGSHSPGSRCRDLHAPGSTVLMRLMCVAGLTLLALPGAATADPYPGSRGNLGGGFIELLMTGTDPSMRQGAPLYNRPPPPAYRQAAPGYRVIQRQATATPLLEVDPYVQPPEPYYTAPRSRTAAPAEPGFSARFEKQEVAYPGRHASGTIIIDTPNRFLFLVTGNGRALRYGIGVGRPGFSWAGVKTISQKREWPDWRPPSEMLKRRPDLPRHMAGGPANPLGARALYLGSSLYRIHGTNEPSTIGRAVSSGCIRMRNQDVIDLYQRVKVGTKVVVI